MVRRERTLELPQSPLSLWAAGESAGARAQGGVWCWLRRSHSGRFDMLLSPGAAWAIKQGVLYYMQPSMLGHMP